VTRYFISVGSALAALLLIASWSFSNSPSSFADRPEIIATAVIRIKSERKWPEKIELDTSQPTIVPPDDVASPLAAQPAPPLPEPRLEALAQLNPDTRLIATEHRTPQIRRRSARTSRSNRVAKASAVNRLARSESGEACCRFGWANNWQPNPDAVSRKHATALGAKDWLALSQR
jgi:hypothetical protein